MTASTRKKRNPYLSGTPIDYGMEATRDCPCDSCPELKGCKVECATFKTWVHYGARTLERKARYHGLSVVGEGDVE